MQRLLLLLTLAGCAKAPARPEPSEPTPAVRALYAEASQRLTSGFLEGGWVVSRTSEGEPRHQGDSLIWSGLSLYALSCEDGAQVEDALLRMLGEGGGGLVRFPGLDKPVSMDGALGLYRGAADRIQRCPGSREKWAPAVQKHLAYVSASNGRLGPEGATLAGDFGYVLDLLGEWLDVGAPADSERAGGLAAQASAWALATVATKSSAYRIHLGLLAFETTEALGADVPEDGRNGFCQTSREAALPGVEWWCGREQALYAFIDGFKYDEWEMRLQRGAWESPDGNGLRTPGLDILVALRTAYQL